MKRLKPFFSYYGSKWSIINKYPKPIYETIVEPFAGSANYALRYPNRQIILNDLDENIYALWKYLIGVSKKEILSLPDIPLSCTVEDFKIPTEAKILIGFWLGRGLSYPNTKPGKWMSNKNYQTRCQWWGVGVRHRIASQLKHIRHWKILNTSYCQLPNTEATYFIDPPYFEGGKAYRLNCINYAKLSFFCQTRLGQSIVCENQNGKWLNFQPLVELNGTRKKSTEYLYYRVTK